MIGDKRVIAVFVVKNLSKVMKELNSKHLYSYNIIDLNNGSFKIEVTE